METGLAEAAMATGGIVSGLQLTEGGLANRGSMSTVGEIRAAALVIGRKRKHANAITALLCGAIPGLIASLYMIVLWHRWLLGIIVGLLWANAFEYFYHRFLLHCPRSSFGKKHLLHHRTIGTPEEPEHVTFGSSPWWVAALFAANGIPALVLDLRLGGGLAPGILTGFSAYLIAVEEIHWRIHLGGWLPPGLQWARKYHLAHHDIPDGRFNVFFPVFDFLFGNIRPPIEQTTAVSMDAAVFAFKRDTAGWLVGWLKTGVVWVWVVAVGIGIRYFWNARPHA
jgi:hypothetical protein